MSASQQDVAARAIRSAERRIADLEAENEKLRVVLRQVRGHVITGEARRLIDAATGRRG